MRIIPYPSHNELEFLEPKIFTPKCLKEALPYEFLLIRIYQEGLEGLNKSEIARRVGKDPTTLGRDLTKLESMKFLSVDRQPLEGGGEEHLIYLTAKGKKQARGLIREQAEWFSVASGTPAMVWARNRRWRKGDLELLRGP